VQRGDLGSNLGRRFRDAVQRQRRLIATLTAIAVIGALAAFISLQLNARSGPAGPPPMDLPAPSHSQLPAIGSSAWATTAPEAAPANCRRARLAGSAGAWIESYLDDDIKNQDLVADEAKAIGLVDFDWVSVASPTNLARTDSFDPSLATELTAAAAASPCGQRFVTMADNDPSLSHSSDVRLMAEILTKPAVREEHVAAVAALMASQPDATGLTVDYEFGLPQTLSDLAIDEQIAGWRGLSLDTAVNQLSDDYTELIRELAVAMHRQHRTLRVAALVRASDDVEAATSDLAPYLLDYGAIADYADQIVLEAYDFHYTTGNPGPIAPFSDVAGVLGYVHSYGVPWTKLAMGIPLYAYDWQVNNQGDIAVSASGQVIPATTMTVTQVASDRKHWHQAATENGETEYTYTKVGHAHIVWDAASALSAETAWLKHNYPGVGVDIWRIGNADPSASALAVKVLGS